MIKMQRRVTLCHPLASTEENHHTHVDKAPLMENASNAKNMVIGPRIVLVAMDLEYVRVDVSSAESADILLGNVTNKISAMADHLMDLDLNHPGEEGMIGTKEAAGIGDHVIDIMTGSIYSNFISFRRRRKKYDSRDNSRGRIKRSKDRSIDRRK